MGEFDLDLKIEGVAGAGWAAHLNESGVALAEHPEHDSAALNTCTSPCTSVACTHSGSC
ncbi:hypothetical protein [Kibdelosporangium aridum]|jgi:hypothetical protein|uniref:Uncharacterized protein n=1 Tax=Kibdelosporangium aridum TaxID=2030 RepID=A0A1W2FMJ2_KIBAR|nr:hypothetical protein [Kibdelosporangium aridum]SMD22818.1 hypothetical protein SAMN05661093_07620 [Kibdelosporangium aridum]